MNVHNCAGSQHTPKNIKKIPHNYTKTFHTVFLLCFLCSSVIINRVDIVLMFSLHMSRHFSGGRQHCKLNVTIILCCKLSTVLDLLVWFVFTNRVINNFPFETGRTISVERGSAKTIFGAFRRVDLRPASRAEAVTVRVRGGRAAGHYLGANYYST